jgi:IS30 family transposase
MSTEESYKEARVKFVKQICETIESSMLSQIEELEELASRGEILSIVQTIAVMAAIDSNMLSLTGKKTNKETLIKLATRYVELMNDDLTRIAEKMPDTLIGD